MAEPLRYRAIKSICQKLTNSSRSNQLEKLQETPYDVVVVLDACRADVLQSVASWPVDSVITPETKTYYWIMAMERANLLDESTHIIAGNAQYSKVDFDATIDRCWESDWNEELSTVLPEVILGKVSTHVSEEGGPVIAHLQQPHWPYVARLSDSWRLAYEDTGPWKSPNGSTDALQVAMANGLVDIEKAEKAYRASVRSVWDVLADYLEQWVDDSLTVVVTADHGELFGRLRELKLYEHPAGCNIPPLTRVPWVTLGPQTGTNTPESVEDTLRALGYAE